MQDFVNQVNSVLWSPALIYLCLGAGLFYSIMTRFVQLRLLRDMIGLIKPTSTTSSQGISSFQALTVSLSGRVGTGNIAGVAAAIGFGGPGAIFWMWIVAFLGAATSFVECTLAQIYKEDHLGELRGGPAYYFEKAMGFKWYAVIFAVTSIIATGLLLPGIQSNSIGNAAEIALGSGITLGIFGGISLVKLIVGSLLVTALGFIIFGGVKRIAKVTQVVVPFMAIAYLMIAFVVIGLNIEQLPGIVAMIVGDAFTPMAGVGAAIGWGVKRGVYSNEAGLGMGAHASAAAVNDHPAQQGLVQSFSIYVDSIIVCSATAFMILITGAYNVHDGDGGFLVQNLAATVEASSPAFTQAALNGMFPQTGNVFVAIALIFFSFTTILAYYYVAETNMTYLSRFVDLDRFIWVLKVALMSSTFYGAIKTADLAWGLGDIGIGFMAWLNIVGMLIIFWMSRPALLALKDYEQQRKAGKSLGFTPSKLGIRNAGYWEERPQKSEASEPITQTQGSPVNS